MRSVNNSERLSRHWLQQYALGLVYSHNDLVNTVRVHNGGSKCARCDKRDWREIELVLFLLFLSAGQRFIFFDDLINSATDTCILLHELIS